MHDRSIRSEEFWRALERRVVARVEEVLNMSERVRAPVIDYLREVEETARAECDRRETIQVIVSARRVLGDCSGADTANRPFAATFGPAL